MASTYSDRLRIELIGTGDQSGTWGITTNTNLGTIIEEAIAGLASITMTDANYTLSVVDGGTDEARQMMIWLSGTLSATRDVICPAEEKLYFVKNGTSGGQSIVFKTSAGTGVTIPNGQTAVVICDGTNVVDGFTYIPALGSAWIKNTGSGYTTFDGSQDGLALTSNAMSTGSKYTPAVKFGSTDANFTTTNPKFGAAVVGVATEAYSADTDGGMALTFWTSPDNPGTGSGLTETMRLTQYGTLGLGASGQQNMLLRMSTDITGSTVGYGIYMDSEVQPDVTSSARYFNTVAATGTNSGTPYTIGNLYHFLSTQGTFDADSTVTNQYGFFSGGSLISADRNYSFFSDLGGEASKTNTSLVRATNVVTVTSAGHGFTDGDLVAITSATSSFNGIFTVTSATTNSFTYSQTGSDQTATEFGYSTRVNRWGFYGNTAPAFIGGPTIISANSGMDGLRITQAGSGAALVVEDSTNPDSTPFVVTADGNVGIGTSSPENKVTVNGSGQFTGAISGNSSGTHVYYQSSLSYIGAWGPNTSTNGTLVFYSARSDGSNGAEYMRIDSSGRVGIGTSPAYNLDVYDSTSAVSRVYGDSTTLSITSRASTDTLAPIQQFHKYRGTQASPTTVADGDVTGRIIFYGYDGAALRATAEIRSTVNGTPGSADMPGSLAFYTTADGAAASTARMLINEAGLIGVGTTTPDDPVGFGSIFDMRSSFGAGIYLRSSAAPTTNYTYVAHAASNSTAYFWNVGNGAIYVGTNNTERFNVSSTGLISLASGAGLSVSATSVTSTAAGNGNVYSGTYNPGANGTNTNVASVTYNTAQYMRVGNQVTVSGSVAVTVTTANTNTVLRMTIPVASNFGGASNAGGAGASASGTYGGGMAILGDATNDGVEMRFQAASTASLTWQYSFSYRVF